MRKSVMAIFVFLFFSFGVVAAESSNGASFEAAPANGCLNSKTEWCVEGDCNSTMEENNACTMGKSNFGFGDTKCCPDAYTCSDQGSGIFQCVPATVQCIESLSLEICEENAGGNYYRGKCLCTSDCGHYLDGDDCRNDVFMYGEGDQNEAVRNCGGVAYTTGLGNCSWNGTYCKRSGVFTDFFSGASPKTYECLWGDIYGDCIDGNQDYDRLAKFKIAPSHPGSPSDCCGGEFNTTRYCGENIVKLPGFSLFSLIVAVFIIGIYYFLSGGFKYHKKGVLK